MIEFKKFNYINVSKKFCNHFHYICLYYRHTHYGISQRQHVFRVYIIHSNCVRLHNFFFFMMNYGGYLHSQMWAKWLQINNSGEGIGTKMSWVEKNRKINNQGGGTIIRDSRVNFLTFLTVHSEICSIFIFFF